MKTIKTFATLLAFIITMPLAAGPIDVAQARMRVVEHYLGQAKRSIALGKRQVTLTEDALQHVYTQKTATGTPAVYVFNAQQGFVLAAADDGVPTILGYSDTGDFDPNNIPDGLKYLMGEYARQIATLSAAPEPNFAPAIDYEVEYTEEIKPLLETQWDQQDPYNRECPMALSAGTSFAATGCMTTAMAQIMRFHKWPERGVGSSYMDAKQGNITVPKEREFYNHTYNWDAMPLSKRSFTPEGASEVSKLMMDVAVALNTTFGSVSSAVHITIIPMLLSYFNYDPGVEFVQMGDDVKGFNSKLIADLRAGRPVYLQGGPNDGGHAFVCDGYDGAGLFHINWGWSGVSDGHFRITNLSPKDAGTGGVANEGYSQKLSMIHNIKPYQGGQLARPEMMASYTRNVKPGIKIDKGQSGYYFGADLGVYPMTPHNRNIRARVGLEVAKPGGSRVILWDKGENHYTEIVRTNSDHTFHIDLDPAWLVEGTEVSYIYQEKGAPDWLYMKNTRGDRCTFSINKNSKNQWVATTGDMVYVIETETPEPTTVAITYNVFHDGKLLGQKVVQEVVGEAPSKDFIPTYYVKAEGFPDVVPDHAETYDINTSYLSTLPIVCGTKSYNLTFSQGGNTYMWYVSNGNAYEVMNPLQQAASATNMQWRFAGNWFDGFTIQNVSKGEFLTAPAYDSGEESRIFSVTSDYANMQRFYLMHRDEGFYFKTKAHNYYIAHTQPTSLDLYLYDQEYYGGNLVTITEVGADIPQPTGVNYTVQITGQPEGETPKLKFGDTYLGQGEQFHAVALDKSQLSATDIDCYTYTIAVGVKDVHLVYSPGPIDYITYTVNISGNYPAGKNPVLTYHSDNYSHGDKLTANSLTPQQLSATEYKDYTYTIEIKSTVINVIYAPINYKTYTYNITGLPNGYEAQLLYNQKPVQGDSFMAGDLELKQLSATYYPDYGYRITIGEDDVITVTYYGTTFFFDTTKGYDNGRNTLTQFPVTVNYFGYYGKNNIYKTGGFTEVTSSEAPIIKIVFVDPDAFSEVTASVGQFDTNTATWTYPDGVQTVKFSGGDAYSTGLYVYLKSPEPPVITHDIVDGVCTLCGHGFFCYTASAEVMPQTTTAFFDKDGNALTVLSQNFADGEGQYEFGAPLAAIGANAFAGCTNLTGTLSLSRRIRSIGDRAFAGCNGVTAVEFRSLPEVAATAFEGVTADKRLVLDDQSYVSTAANPGFPVVTSASYGRNLANEWGTIVVPFDVAAAGEGYELYELSRLNGDELVLAPMKGTVSAGTPALILMSEEALDQDTYRLNLAATGNTVTATGTLAAPTVDGLTLRGSYKTTNITDQEGFIISKNKFWNIQTSKGTNNVYNAPFRGYISAASPMLVSQLSLSTATDDQPTDLGTLNAIISGEAEYYDLNGRRLTHLQPGVNVVKQADGTTVKVILKR